MTPAEPLDPAFFARPADKVARALLGALIVSRLEGETAIGRIVETEAYVGPHDPASHAAERIGRTRRNETMFGPPGIAYVYRSYGVHWCLNAVTDTADYPAAVLIRAIEPIVGLDVMRLRRWGRRSRGPDTAIGSGPGKLTAALGITGALDGHSLDREPLFFAPGSRVHSRRIETSARIGVTKASDWPLRFVVVGSPHASR